MPATPGAHVTSAERKEKQKLLGRLRCQCVWGHTRTGGGGGDAFQWPGDTAKGSCREQSIRPHAVPCPHLYGRDRGCCWGQGGLSQGNVPGQGAAKNPAARLWVPVLQLKMSVPSLMFCRVLPLPYICRFAGSLGNRGVQRGDGMKSKGGLRETGGGRGGG